MELGVGIMIGIFALLAIFGFIVASTLRRVVPTNEVHIVQSTKKTISFGSASEHGNTYYAWPSWVPFFGVNSSTLPVSVFDLDLTQYEAYDSGRLPFLVDVKAFFRITESDIAAQRVANFDELHGQLKAIVQGAVRSILASYPIEQIMAGRSSFGEHFTKEVCEQLSNWGVSSVKNIELMDLKDAPSSYVIKNITAKKNSQIEMESRTEVALNKQKAEVAEIEAKREVELINQSAKQTTGLRQVEADRLVKLESEKATQMVKEQQKITKQREMDVVEVENVKIAEINRKVNTVKAEQDKDVTIVTAQAKLESQKLQAEGAYQLTKRQADGIEAEGAARAGAESAMQMAPVTAQLALAKEIGDNVGYQKYLVDIRQLEANQMVGIEQAKALAGADIKVIANSGTPSSGVKSVSDLFSSNGGMQVGAMLEGLKNTEVGAALLKTVGVATDSKLN